MNLMTRYQPWNLKGDPFWQLQEELNRLREIPFTSGKGAWGPEMDVYDSKDSVMVRANIPGLKKEDIDISIQDGVLVIRGEKTRKEEHKSIVREERFFGSFTRAVTLPEGVDAEKTKAVYQNGVLELTLLKQEESRPKPIRVRVL